MFASKPLNIQSSQLYQYDHSVIYLQKANKYNTTRTDYFKCSLYCIAYNSSNIRKN